jgi:23S rRNA (guanosine2251-2'-O)-methyltransferase
VWATRRAADEPWLRGVEVIEARPEQIEERCGSSAHQGICAEAGPYPYADAAELLAAPDPLIVALDELEDPQNVGAICRTAECVGATGVVLPERRSAEVTPAVCKASAGAVEYLRVAQVRNLADFLGEAKATGCWVYGAAGVEGSQPYDRQDYRGGVVLVLGAEGKGLRRRVAQSCDVLVSLPLRGRIGSLNVSAAASALLYEILQRRLDSGT